MARSAVPASRRGRRLVYRLAAAGGVLGPTAAIALTAGASPVAAGAGASPVAVSAGTIYETLTTLVHQQPPTAALPGETVTLPDKAWVESELARVDLTAAERQVLEEAPVSMTNDGPAPTATSIPVAPGDPIASNICNAQDELGQSVATIKTYWGFTGTTWKGLENISTLSTPSSSFISTLYTRTSFSWGTSQPGPPTPHMSGRVETDFAVAYIDFPSYVATQNFNFHGHTWTASCSS